MALVEPKWPFPGTLMAQYGLEQPETARYSSKGALNSPKWSLTACDKHKQPKTTQNGPKWPFVWPETA